MQLMNQPAGRSYGLVQKRPNRWVCGMLDAGGMAMRARGFISLFTLARHFQRRSQNANAEHLILGWSSFDRDVDYLLVPLKTLATREPCFCWCGARARIANHVLK